MDSATGKLYNMEAVLLHYKYLFDARLSDNMTTLVLLLPFALGSDDFVNKYDEPFTFQCPDGQFISRMSGVHDNYHEDRRFSFSCRRVCGLKQCTWHDYANAFDAVFDFRCPNHGVMSGVSSLHDNHYEDRRFKFYCCELKGQEWNNCKFSDYINDWDKTFDYKVPAGHVLRGISSRHSNYYEDRRWKFQTCILS